MENQVIASYTLSNVGGIAIYAANDEQVTAGYNDEKPRKYKVYINSKGFYFNWGKRRIYLHECLRCM